MPCRYLKEEHSIVHANASGENVFGMFQNQQENHVARGKQAEQKEDRKSENPCRVLWP